MATIGELIDFEKAISEAVEETTEEIKNYQQQQMVLDGKRSDGEEINPLHGRYTGYAPFTIEEKKRKGQRYDHVTLRDTFQFQTGIYVKTERNKVVINSTDSKTDTLINYYGEEIFGLNKERASEYSLNDLAPVAIKKIINQI
jgi:hypothetical protein